MENRQFEAMLAVAQERLAQHIPEDIAEKAGAQYADGSFSLKTLEQTVAVRLSDCTIQPLLSKWHALTLLHYLDLADGAPLTGRTITFSRYKDGLVRGGAVSYTHLVVDLDRTARRTSAVAAIGIARDHRVDVRGVFLVLVGDSPTEPVSYTHLDVYKRQVINTVAELLIYGHRPWRKSTILSILIRQKKRVLAAVAQ